MNKIKTTTEYRVGVIHLEDPKSLNSLDQIALQRIIRALVNFDQNSEIGCILIKGTAKAFSAGGNIKEMSRMSHSEAFLQDIFEFGQRILQVRKPIVAAVSGFALGGGCELAMACDVIVAARSAIFGQPEIKLGVIPGMGGTQRLTKAVGKYKAMDMCLTGRTITAEEAERYGLISRLVEDEELEETAQTMAQQISEMSLPAALMVKEAVNASFETGLSQGLIFERRSFHSLFSTHGQIEGMSAFLEKRPAVFQTSGEAK